MRNASEQTAKQPKLRRARAVVARRRIAQGRSSGTATLLYPSPNRVTSDAIAQSLPVNPSALTALIVLSMVQRSLMVSSPRQWWVVAPVMPPPLQSAWAIVPLLQHPRVFQRSVPSVWHAASGAATAPKSRLLPAQTPRTQALPPPVREPLTQAIVLTAIARQMIQAQAIASGLALLTAAIVQVRQTQSFAAPIPGLLTTIAIQYIVAGRPDLAMPLLDRVGRMVQTMVPSPLPQCAIAAADILQSAALTHPQLHAQITLATCYLLAGSAAKAMDMIQQISDSAWNDKSALYRELVAVAIAHNQLDAAEHILHRLPPATLHREPTLRLWLQLCDRYTALGQLAAATRILDAALLRFALSRPGNAPS